MLVISSMRNVDVDSFDAVYAIVRSYRNRNPRIQQLDVLSPSWDLLGKYRALVKSGNWNESTFNSVYVPQFIAEMNSKQARSALNALYKLDKQGKKVALVCFCGDESLCHRSIVAGLLQAVGCDVRAGGDYRRFYELFRALK